MFGKLDKPEMIENYAQPVNESINIGKFTIVNTNVDWIYIYKESESGLDDDIELRAYRPAVIEAVIEKFYQENF